MDLNDRIIKRKNRSRIYQTKEHLMQFLQKNQRFKRGEEGKVIFYKENFLNEFFYVCLFICIFPGACVKVFGNVEKHNTI